MITGFEKQTHELTPYERMTILPLVISGLSQRKGKARAITNSTMVKALNRKGYKITGPRLRKVIHEIRITGAVKRLVATSKGYYVSSNRLELLAYIESLEQRAESIRAIAKQIQHQLNETT